MPNKPAKIIPDLPAKKQIIESVDPKEQLKDPEVKESNKKVTNREDLPAKKQIIESVVPKETKNLKDPEEKESVKKVLILEALPEKKATEPEAIPEKKATEPEALPEKKATEPEALPEKKVTELEDVPAKNVTEPEDLPAKEKIENVFPKATENLKDPEEKESVKNTPDNLAEEKKVTPYEPGLYRIMFFMKQFRPHDIVIKVINRTLIIDAKHQEHVDEHGFVTRSMVRKQYLPDDVMVEKLASYFTADGVLIFQAPRQYLNQL